MSQYLLYREKYLDIKGGSSSFLSGIGKSMGFKEKEKEKDEDKIIRLLALDTLTNADADFLKQNNKLINDNYMITTSGSYIKKIDILTQNEKNQVEENIFNEEYMITTSGTYIKKKNLFTQAEKDLVAEDIFNQNYKPNNNKSSFTKIKYMDELRDKDDLTEDQLKNLDTIQRYTRNNKGTYTSPKKLLQVSSVYKQYKKDYSDYLNGDYNTYAYDKSEPNMQTKVKIELQSKKKKYNDIYSFLPFGTGKNIV